MIDCMYKICETEMSDSPDIAVLLNHHMGPIMIICQIKKRYISISQNCAFLLEQTGGNIIWLSWDVLYNVI